VERALGKYQRAIQHHTKKDLRVLKRGSNYTCNTPKIKKKEKHDFIPKKFLQTKQFRREGYASDISLTPIIFNQNKLKNSDAIGLLNRQVMHAKKLKKTQKMWNIVLIQN